MRVLEVKRLKKIYSWMSSHYKRLIIRVFDSFLPLGGELDLKGYVVLRGYIPEGINLEEKDELEKFLLSDRYILDIFQSYIGSKTFEYSELWEAPSSSSSGVWHHDSVGHRVKVFVSLSDASDNLGTQIIPNTHKMCYQDYNHTRLKVSKKNEAEAQLITMNRRDVLIFDTNAIHRGVYGKRTRIVHQFELCTGLKGKMLPGHIGVRSD